MTVWYENILSLCAEVQAVFMGTPLDPSSSPPEIPART